MFTLLPSLYIIGADYFRKWSTYYHQQSIPSEIYENHRFISKIDNDLNHKIKSHRQKSNHRRRKTSISELNHDDIIYLMSKTGFTREEIILWYEDFLVCIYMTNTKEKRCSVLFFI